MKRKKMSKLAALIIAIALALQPMSAIAKPLNEDAVTEEIQETKSTEEVTEPTEEVTTEDKTSEATTEDQTSETTTEDMTEAESTEKSTSEASTETASTTAASTEATTEVTTEITTALPTEATTEAIKPKVEAKAAIKAKAAADNLSWVIYSDGIWDNGIVWMTLDSKGNKHYVFCLDKGQTMENARYTGKVSAMLSGKRAYRISSALHYFYAKNSNSWAGKSKYGTTQTVIWGERDSDGLYEYVDQSWKLSEANSDRSAGKSSYSNKLTTAKKSNINDAASRKALFSKITKVQTVSATGYNIDDTISLGGTAWNYFADKKFGTSLKVMGVYDSNGNVILGSSASINGGNLKIDHTITPGGPGDKNSNNPISVVIKANFPYGASAGSLDCLKTPTGIQNMSWSYNNGSKEAYFVIKAYAKTAAPRQDIANFSISKYDVYGNIVDGCEFTLTKPDSSTNKQTTSNGDVNFKLDQVGTYSLKETKVPNGYSLNPNTLTFTTIEKLIYTDAAGKEIHTFPIPDDAIPVNMIVIDGVPTQSGGSPFPYYTINGGLLSLDTNNNYAYNCMNQITPGGAKLNKTISYFSSYNKETGFVADKKPGANIQFNIYAAETISVATKTPNSTYDLLNSTYYTTVFTKGQKINNGTKWGANNCFTVSMTNGGKTDANGNLTISNLPNGNYYAEEIFPDGVNQNSKHYPFKVKAGQITTIKNDYNQDIINEQTPCRVNVLKYVHGVTNESGDMIPLSNAEFTLYAHVNNKNYFGANYFTAADTEPAIVSRDLAKNKENKVENTWVPIQTVTSNDAGYAVFTNIPVGKYLVVETKAPEGYAPSEKSYEFEHTLAKYDSSGYTFTHTFTDIKSHSYTIKKLAEVAKKSTNKKELYIYDEEKLPGITFGLYAAEDIKNTNDDVVFEKDSRIDELVTDEDGQAIYKGILFKGKYYFKELKTYDDSKYILDEEKYEFEISDSNEEIVELNEDPLVNKLYKGSLKLIKYDAENNEKLQCVKFNLLDAGKEKLGTYTTDKNGEIKVEDLPVGTYYFVETEALSNYTLDDTAHEITITKQQLDPSINVTNKRMKGSIKIIKTDGKTKEAIPGVTFALYDKNNKQLSNYTTDKNGEILIKALDIDTYYIREVKAAKNYILDDTLKEVVITADNLNHTLKIKNDKMRGSIKIIKTDGRTETPLKDVEFTLYNSKDKKIDTYTTDKNGEIIIEELEIGTYYIQETKTLTGYRLDDKKQKVVIDTDKLNITLKVKNYRTDTSITVRTTSKLGSGGFVKTGDLLTHIIFFIFVLSLLAYQMLFLYDKKEYLIKANKKYVFLLLFGVGILTTSINSYAEDAAIKVLNNIEHNGKTYKYVEEQTYESKDPDEKKAFNNKDKTIEDVTYEVVETIPGKKTVQTSKEYKNLLEKDESKIDQTVTVDGIDYKLKNIEWTEIPNIEKVTAFVDFGYCATEPIYEKTHEYTYTSEITKKEITVTLPFKNLEKGEESWVDGFSATITFNNLDGKYFTLGNHEFEYNPNSLSLTDSDYNEIIRMLGYDTNLFRLTSASWSGQPYTSNGVKCRDAVTTGQQFAAKYKAFYEDDVENGKIYKATASYETEVEDETNNTYKIKGTAYYKNPISAATVAAITLGILVLVILVIGILYVLSKKKKEETKGNNNKNEVTA